MASLMWDGPDKVWDSTDNGRLKQHHRTFPSRSWDSSGSSPRMLDRYGQQSLSRPTKPIHSAKEGWRGFFGRLAERMLG